MANNCVKTPATGCLEVTIQESIILPNYNVQESYNSFTVCGINNYVTRTEVIDYQWSGSLTTNGIGIIGFVPTKQELTPGAFVSSDVKYIRITNFPSSDKFASIYCVKTNDESVTFKVEPGKSLILANDAFDVPSVVSGSLVYMSEIKAMAGDGNDTTYSGSIQIEYVVASA
jgi:hypothetical protein